MSVIPFRGGPQGPAWLAHAVVDDRQRPIANLANALVAIRHDPDLAEAFSFDEMKRAVIVDGRLPALHAQALPELTPTPRLLLDADVIAVQEYLQHLGLPRIGREAIRDAILLRARERAFHPVQDFLSSLVWDGRPRLDDWLGVYLGADDGEYAKAVGRMFLVSAVARIFRPGCKVDYVLVLQGGQGVEKSAACAILGGDWFSDALPDIRGKDSSQHVRDRWFVEIPELSAFSRADIEVLKAYITRPTERYRPSYGREIVEEPRQCVFMATTNAETFLRDETGNRRFWPIRVRKTGLAALKADRDQLFAEAVAAFRNGDKWWPSPDLERRIIKSEQEARRELDPWHDQIAAFVVDKAEVFPGVIAREACGIQTASFATADLRRITKVLTTLEWRRSDKKNNAGIYPYVKL